MQFVVGLHFLALNALIFKNDGSQIKAIVFGIIFSSEGIFGDCPQQGKHALKLIDYDLMVVTMWVLFDVWAKMLLNAPRKMSLLEGVHVRLLQRFINVNKVRIYTYLCLEATCMRANIIT